ncbi:uncharacterized protein LOC118509557 [Anopheles stephensi]|uniref:Uncharacterized protein n=1 Tax=Anopheles stephensi TaxID=30069 RepID=A0A182YLW2_ANOST|nr:uncharacterized protein LOC118509557 [Anopheles stephensi]XP_035906205.1 uncharacterized protein LOC118509557 [Anopheles stephensi]
MAQQGGTSRTRAPLAELPVVSPGATVPHSSPTPGLTAVAPQRSVLTPRLIDSPRANIPDSILTPTLSPDEMAIRQRARRRPPIIWSPDHGARAQLASSMHTPTKNVSSMTLRSSPRKRSLMQEFADVPSTSGLSTPTKRLQQTGRMSVGDSPGTSSKRSKFDETAMNRRNESIPLSTILRGYSQDQLIGIIGSMLAKAGHLEAAVRRELPLPDISPLDAELGRIKRNIYASVPNLKLFSRTDGHGFLRAATHLATFKQTIHSQAQNLYASRHWDALLDYVLMAWTHVRETPVYDNSKHNATRRYCFKLLAHHATSALKHGGLGLGTERVGRFEQKLPGMVADCAEISECCKCVEYIMKGL